MLKLLLVNDDLITLEIGIGLMVRKMKTIGILSYCNGIPAYKLAPIPQRFIVRERNFS